MQLSQRSASVFCPDGRPPGAALRSARQLGIVAHADDLEISAIKGILDCFDAAEPGFCGVVACDGAGAPKRGDLLDLAEHDYQALRQREQEHAATLGRYAAVVTLAHPSANVRGRDESLGRDLDAILGTMTPEVVYTHNPVDSHDTHVAVMLEVIAALRRCPASRRPRRIIGCEVWRDLDWLPAGRRVALDVGARLELQEQLLSAYGSQIDGGKRYDLAVLARRRAHATFNQADRADETTGLVFGVDLSSLVEPNAPEVADFVAELLDDFRRDVEARLARLGAWK
jgi:LmbE family N-acetylglucosaminyl deacetylase